MAYARPATTYTGNTVGERYRNSSSPNRANFDLFLDDLAKWISILASRSSRENKSVTTEWADIVTAPIDQDKRKKKHEVKRLMAPLVLLWEYLSIDGISHLPAFWLLSFAAGYFLPITGGDSLPTTFSFWLGFKFVLMWMLLAVVTGTLSFIFDVIHPHCGGPQSCVGCAAVGHVLGWFWFLLLGGGYVFFGVLDVYGWISSCVPASLWLTILYLLTLLNLTLSNLPVYGAYYHLWGHPGKALPGLGLTLLFIALSFLLFQYVC